jgi:hypothetical protein
MSSGIEEQLQAIDGTTLTPLVKRALDREDVRVADWRSQPIYGGVEMGSSLYRFSGGAQAAGAVIPWTLILKIVQAPPGENGDPQGVKYWKREALAYRSGLLSSLPGDLAAPRCYEAIEHPGGAYWVWMQDIQDDVGDTWPLEHYRTVARCLGQFNGAYLMGQPLPTHPWLTRKWLRQYVEQAAPAVALLLDSMDHPLIRRALPGLDVEFIQRTWNERYAIFEAIERLPQTFCHLDAFRRNLFSRRTVEGSNQVVAVDWSYMGIASVGEELAPLVGASIGFYAVMPADALRLEQIVLEGYLAGLSDAGWQGNPDLVRFSYAATLYWRSVFGAFVGEMVPWMLDERYHAAIERATGHTMEEGADYTALLIEFYQHVYDQVQELKAALD